MHIDDPRCPACISQPLQMAVLVLYCWIIPPLETAAKEVFCMQSLKRRRSRKRKAEQRAREGRCCANARDEWRQWARERDLIPQPVPAPRSKTRELMDLSHKKGCRLSVSKHRKHDKRLDDSKGRSCFLELPPELREIVYYYYVESWPQSCRNSQSDSAIPVPPHEPPITRTCRIIRDESIPVFYSTWRFPVVLHARNMYLQPLEFQQLDWYHHLGSEKFALIRHFDLHLCMKKAGAHWGSMPTVSWTINIDLDPIQGSTATLDGSLSVPRETMVAMQRSQINVMLGLLSSRLASIDRAIEINGGLANADLDYLIPEPFDRTRRTASQRAVRRNVAGTI